MDEDIVSNKLERRPGLKRENAMNVDGPRPVCLVSYEEDLHPAANVFQMMVAFYRYSIPTEG